MLYLKKDGLLNVLENNKFEFIKEKSTNKKRN